MPTWRWVLVQYQVTSMFWRREAAGGGGATQAIGAVLYESFIGKRSPVVPQTSYPAPELVNGCEWGLIEDRLPDPVE